MALPLEASSLSSITQLAGNPPRYPRNPTEKKRESLVLYIARVPGSRGECPFLRWLCVLSNRYRRHINDNEATFEKCDGGGRVELPLLPAC